MSAASMSPSDDLSYGLTTSWVPELTLTDASELSGVSAPK